MDDLQKAVGELKVVVESSMCLGQLVVDKSTNPRHHSSRDHMFGAFCYCDMLKSVEEARSTLCHLPR